jgi:hypothetical protein
MLSTHIGRKASCCFVFVRLNRRPRSAPSIVGPARDTSISVKPGKETAEIALVIQIGPRTGSRWRALASVLTRVGSENGWQGNLGIREVDDGIWLVSFMHYDLGYFDLEQKTLQPLGNPFGTRLSPMS